MAAEVAVIVPVGVNSDGRRDVLSMDMGLSEAETFWTAFPPVLDQAASSASIARSRGAPTGRHLPQWTPSFASSARPEVATSALPMKWRSRCSAPMGRPPLPAL